MTKTSGSRLQNRALDLARRIQATAARSTTTEIILSEDRPSRENEMLLFFKPEVFFDGVDTIGVAADALRLLGDFGLEVSFGAIVCGAELDRLSIMDAHYGYINRISRYASKELTQSELNFVRQSMGASPDTPVFGGHEILAKHPTETAESLDRLWASKQSIKLRSGLYVQQFAFGGSEIVIVNGFHPAQLAHFTAPDRRIALFVVHSDLPWRFIRQRILGDTFPERALPGTIRRRFLDDAAEYGLQNVSIAANGIHLSAGPFEAAFELRNFLGRLGAGHDPHATNVGQRLAQAELNLDHALSNPKTRLNSNDVTLFDATEEMDTVGAIEIFRAIYAGGDAR